MPAIIFDFFGTLTDPLAESDRQETFAATAAVMGVPAKDFWLAMSRSFPGRIVGVHGGTRATLQAMARQCGVEPTAGQLDRAVVVQHEGAARVRRARPGVFEVLDELRGRGFLLGLISDCSSELYESWDETAYAARFDAAVFSWREGYRKPDPRLYATVTQQLGVATRLLVCRRRRQPGTLRSSRGRNAPNSDHERRIPRRCPTPQRSRHLPAATAC